MCYAPATTNTPLPTPPVIHHGLMCPFDDNTVISLWLLIKVDLQLAPSWLLAVAHLIEVLKCDLQRLTSQKCDMLNRDLILMLKRDFTLLFLYYEQPDAFLSHHNMLFNSYNHRCTQRLEIWSCLFLYGLKGWCGG